jgi:hypothetical protein
MWFLHLDPVQIIQVCFEAKETRGVMVCLHHRVIELGCDMKLNDLNLIHCR